MNNLPSLTTIHAQLGNGIHFPSHIASKFPFTMKNRYLNIKNDKTLEKQNKKKWKIIQIMPKMILPFLFEPSKLLFQPMVQILGNHKKYLMKMMEIIQHQYH